MAEIVLPRYLIGQLCLAGGWRQCKKPVLPKPVSPIVSRFGYRPTAVAPNLYSLPNFENWEYRFWAATLSLDEKTTTSECRGCGAVFNEIHARRRHIGEMGCAKRLTAAYKLLLKDKMCVICNMRSYQEKWGVPLCCPGCTEAWCKAESQPQPLAAALVLVGDGA